MARRLLAAAVVGALGLVVAFVLWRLPADEFILTPDRAKPSRGRSRSRTRDPGDTSVYYVDVFVRRTSLLEQLLPFTQPEGSTVLPSRRPAARDLGGGARPAERAGHGAIRADRGGGRAAGARLRGRREATGILVTSVAPDAPAAGRIEQGDVVVRVDGREVGPLTSSEVDRPPHARRRRGADQVSGERGRAHRGDRAEPGRSG